jgi:hypothetical protein
MPIARKWVRTSRSPPDRALLRAAALSIALQGCALPTAGIHGGLHVIQPLPANLGERPRLGVRRLPSAETADDVEAAQLVEEFVSRARREPLFASVVEIQGTEPASVDLELTVRVTKVERVTARERMWEGVMAGRAIVAAEVHLVEVGSGRVLGLGEAGGYSDEFRPNGTTEGAVQVAAREIVRFVTGEGRVQDRRDTRPSRAERR